jgi:hypothetical protein
VSRRYLCECTPAAGTAGVASILSPSRETRARRRPGGQKKFVPESVPYPYLYAKMHRTVRNGKQHAD